MLTGDHPATARTIGHALGLVDDDIVARATPADKIALVQALQAAGDVVAVTGDGVNDAPPLGAPTSASRWDARVPRRRARQRQSSSPMTTSRRSSPPSRKGAGSATTFESSLPSSLVRELRRGRRVRSRDRRRSRRAAGGHPDPARQPDHRRAAGAGVGARPGCTQTMNTPPRRGAQLFDRRRGRRWHSSACSSVARPWRLSEPAGPSATTQLRRWPSRPWRCRSSRSCSPSAPAGARLGATSKRLVERQRRGIGGGRSCRRATLPAAPRPLRHRRPGPSEALVVLGLALVPLVIAEAAKDLARRALRRQRRRGPGRVSADVDPVRDGAVTICASSSSERSQPRSRPALARCHSRSGATTSAAGSGRRTRSPPE